MSLLNISIINIDIVFSPAKKEQHSSYSIYGKVLIFFLIICVTHVCLCVVGGGKCMCVYFVNSGLSA